MNDDESDIEFDDGDDFDRTCSYCHGTGGDPCNNYILPCPKCDGEGYEWWL